VHRDRFRLFMQLFCLRVQQPCTLHKVQYSADRDVTKVTLLTPYSRNCPHFMEPEGSYCIPKSRHLSLSGTSLFQSIMSLFHCLGHTSVSVQVRGFLRKRFVTGYIFTARSCLHLAQPPSCRTTPCCLSTTAYLIYSQPPYLLEALPPSAT